MTSRPPGAAARGFLKSPLDLGGGLFLLGLAALGLAGGFNLPTGTLSGIGSGFMPRVVAILVGAFGVLLIVQAFLFEGDRLESWHLRGPVFVLGAVMVFGLLVRGQVLSTVRFNIDMVPFSIRTEHLATVTIPALGLIVAGPLAVIISSFAAKDTKPLEVMVFAVLMTLLCGLLFKEALGLPIPFDPFGLIPDPVYRTYVGAKSSIAQGFGIVKNLFTR